MSDLEAFAGLVSLDHGLFVVSTSRADGTIPVVNVGVLEHPGTCRPVVVLRGGRGLASADQPPGPAAGHHRDPCRLKMGRCRGAGRAGRAR